MHLTVFSKCFQGKGFFFALDKPKFRSSLQVRLFRELSDRSNNDNSLGIWLWMCFNSVLPPLLPDRLLTFTIVVRYWFLRVLQSWTREERMEIRHIKMPQSLFFFFCFFLYQDSAVILKFFRKCCLDCYKFWVNFQSFGIVDFDNFYLFSYCFYGGETIWRSYSSIFTSFLSFLFSSEKLTSLPAPPTHTHSHTYLPLLGCST